MSVLFIQNFGVFEWMIIISIIMLLVRRSTMREAGRKVGRVTGGSGTETPPAAPPDRLQAHFKTLELPPNSSYQQVQNAYRDLVKVWHPDRFGTDEKLKEKATAKLQEINAAYEALRLHFESLSQRG